MYRIENGQVYLNEQSDTYDIWAPYGPEYRVSINGSVKAWERFNTEIGDYVDEPEYTEPFPPASVATPSPEDRIAALETENAALKATLDDMILNSPIPAMQAAIDEIILTGGGL